MNNAFALVQSRLKECAQAIREAVQESLCKECIVGLNEDLKGIVGLYRLR